MYNVLVKEIQKKGRYKRVKSAVAGMTERERKMFVTALYMKVQRTMAPVPQVAFG